MEFFLGCFEIIWEDLVRVMEESRIEGRIHVPLNATFLTLMPKVDALETFDDFHPISLCNFVYKIISKIIVKGIKGTLSKNISKEHGRSPNP